MRQLKTSMMFQSDFGTSGLFWLLRLIDTRTYLLTYLLTYLDALHRRTRNHEGETWKQQCWPLHLGRLYCSFAIVNSIYTVSRHKSSTPNSGDICFFSFSAIIIRITFICRWQGRAEVFCSRSFCESWRIYVPCCRSVPIDWFISNLLYCILSMNGRTLAQAR